MKVPFYQHDLSTAEIQNITNVINSPMLTTGKYAKEFEEKFPAFLQLDPTLYGCVTTSSWTTAATMVLRYWGVGAEHDVLLPAITFVACANIVRNVGANPVLVDVDERTGLICQDDLLSKITDRTRAVMVVHLYGNMVQLSEDALTALNKRNIKILEDCAHSVESSTVDNVTPGLQGDAACFSFYATKNLTCGEGGAVVSRDTELLDFIRRDRLHGMSQDAMSRYTDGFKHYNVSHPGLKANLPDILACLLIPQLDTILSRRQKRESIVSLYETRLQDAGYTFVPSVTARNARHLMIAKVPPKQRDKILFGLQAEGIGVAVNFKPVYSYSPHTELKTGSSDWIADEFGSSIITLPLYSSMTHVQVHYVVDSLIKVSRNIDEKQ